jgi:cell wall-associated NlpC family hydrolase
LVVVIAVLGALSGKPSTTCATPLASLPTAGTSGRSLTGRVSWFGGPHDPTTRPVTASGEPISTPGIAVYDTATLGGYWQIEFPDRHLAVLPQTDVGPAPWTGRVLDVTYSALPDLGYSAQSFPTDATVTAVYLGKSVGAAATCTATTGDGSTISVAAAADALDQLHVPYNYSGGHVTPARPTAGLEGPHAGLDCSSAVSYVLQHAGVDIPTLDSTAFMSWGEPGPGRQVTIYANTGHVFLRVGGRYFGTSGFGHPAAGTGPAWFTVTPSPGYLAAFVLRHPRGL